jgi:aldose 1-epimerase
MQEIRLGNAHGPTVRLAECGATLAGFALCGARGTAQVVLGPAEIGELPDFPAAGATIGRVANRIAGASFELDGIRYALPANDGANHLHGGPGGFGRIPWQLAAPAGERPRSARFTLVSPDGDQGYPGRLAVDVTFTLGEDDDLTIAYAATTGRPTPVNLTNHAYFNLAGSGDVLDHELWIDADRWLPIDRERIPTGEIAGVAGTPFDFRSPERIGARIAALVPVPGGYDHCLVFRAGRDPSRPCVRLGDPSSGRSLEIVTDQPAVQVYTGNLLRDVRTADGTRFGRHGAVCLETQHFPDAVHHPAFPDVVLRPEQTYASVTTLRFSNGG